MTYLAHLEKAIFWWYSPVSEGDVAASEEPELIAIAEAREILGVSKPRMAELLKEGVLIAEDNPLDKRSKLVKRADVEALARRAGRHPKNEPAAAA